MKHDIDEGIYRNRLRGNALNVAFAGVWAVWLLNAFGTIIALNMVFSRVDGGSLNHEKQKIFLWEISVVDAICLVFGSAIETVSLIGLFTLANDDPQNKDDDDDLYEYEYE